MSLPRMSVHIGDYLKDTRHLRAQGHGAYLMLIMHYWATGGLPSDDRQLASIACMSDRDWKQIKPTIQAFFGEGWTHKRIDAELAAAQAKYERRAAAGKRGGEARAVAKQCSSNAKAEPKQPITPTDKELDDGGDAGARPWLNRPPLIRPEAFALANEIAMLCGYDPEEPPASWCGAPMRVEMWLADGWHRDQILPSVKAVLASKRDGPPNSIKYFERAIAISIAQQNQPLPTIQAIPGETVNVRPQADRSVVAAADRILARIREFDGPGGGDEPRPHDVRLLSDGRR